MTINILEEVQDELVAARAANHNFNSAHEGWAVMLEEVKELWEEVRKKRKVRSKQRMREECIQIAAMAVRFIEDICE